MDLMIRGGKKPKACVGFGGCVGLAVVVLVLCSSGCERAGNLRGQYGSFKPPRTNSRTLIHTQARGQIQRTKLTRHNTHNLFHHKQTETYPNPTPTTPDPHTNGKRNTQCSAITTPLGGLADVGIIGGVVSPSLNSAMPALPTPKKGQPRILCIVHKDAESPLSYPPHLDRGKATWGEAAVQLKRRLAWTEDGFGMEILDAGHLTEELLKEHTRQADIFVFFGLGENKTAADLAAHYTQIIPTGACFGCSNGLSDLTRVDYQPANSFTSLKEKLSIPFMPPWSESNQLARLFETIQDLYQRSNHLDLYYALLLLVDQLKRVDLVGARSKLDIKGLYCLISNCRKPLLKCLKNPTCKKCVDELEKVGLRDQVKAYSIIRSYESKEFERLSLCINEKNNCLRNDAQRPLLPNVEPIKTWQGKDLTFEKAEDILIGRRSKDNPISWVLVCGQNPAYDEFPCQYQMFYRGKARGSLWYNPVFKVNTLDGEEVWRRSDYKVRHTDVPGKFTFTFCDNGVTSKEFWHIVDAADDLSWAILYYSGAAKTAGQAYIGAMLATPDGSWPKDSELPRISASLERAGIPWHEMVQVCNGNCEGAPLTPLHAEKQ